MKNTKDYVLSILYCFLIMFVFFGLIFLITTGDIGESLKTSFKISIILSLFCCGLVFLLFARIKIPESLLQNAIFMGIADYLSERSKISGKLVLTKEQLVFCASKSSLIGTEMSISISNIEKATYAGSLFQIIVICKDGTFHIFSVFSGKKWLSKINELVKESAMFCMEE